MLKYNGWLLQKHFTDKGNKTDKLGQENIRKITEIIKAVKLL